jgi:hypothetical protein
MSRALPPSKAPPGVAVALARSVEQSVCSWWPSRYPAPGSTEPPRARGRASSVGGCGMGWRARCRGIAASRPARRLVGARIKSRRSSQGAAGLECRVLIVFADRFLQFSDSQIEIVAASSGRLAEQR